MTHIDKRMGLKTNKEDREVVELVIDLLREKEVTVDRASKILQDAQTIIPLITKLKL